MGLRQLGCVGVVDQMPSKLQRTASADAWLTASILIVCVGCAFAYDVHRGLGGLLPVFVLASTPLLLGAGLDVFGRRRSPRHDPAAPPAPGTEAGRAAGGLALLVFGAVFTVIEVGVGGVKSSDFEVWTSTAVGYLLMAALGSQSLLLVLSWSIRRQGRPQPG